MWPLAVWHKFDLNVCRWHDELSLLRTGAFATDPSKVLWVCGEDNFQHLFCECSLRNLDYNGVPVNRVASYSEDDATWWVLDLRSGVLGATRLSCIQLYSNVHSQPNSTCLVLLVNFFEALDAKLHLAESVALLPLSDAASAQDFGSRVIVSLWTLWILCNAFVSCKD